jgi:hypothetical protein
MGDDEAALIRLWREKRGEIGAGVEFIDENGGGPGVRLAKRCSQKS